MPNLLGLGGPGGFGPPGQNNKGPGFGFLDRGTGPTAQPPIALPPAPGPGSQLQGSAPTAPAAAPPGGGFDGSFGDPQPPSTDVGSSNEGKAGFDPFGTPLFFDPAKVGSKITDQFRAYQSAGGSLNFGQFQQAYSASQAAGGGFNSNGGTVTDPQNDPRRPGDSGQSQQFIDFLKSIGLNIDAAGLPQDGSNTNRFDQAAGQFGGELFGTGKLSDSYAGLIANILSGEIGRQGGRATEQEGLLRDLIMQGQSSSANQLNESALAGAQQLTDPAALDSLREKLVNQARSTSAAGENASMNRLRDLGVVGQGGAATGAVNQASNLANQGLQRNLTGIDVGIEGIQRQRLQQAGQMAAQGGDTFRSLGQNPQLQLADRLGSAFNPATGSLTDFLGQMLNVHQGQALAASTGSNFFEGGGGQLLGGLIGGVGSALGGGGLEALLKKR